ncbi:SERTA domain containing 1 L homeolog [Xenopus laevis]|nr:SERTA domain containing 1 L homeolog [Xenopus laevis]AAH74195.1 MGC82098 protein [Xenopus laevis]
MGSNPDPVLERECCSIPAIQSHCLMNISLVKLHRSLRHVEPDLRHFVLVANTLRRLQGNLQVEQCAPDMWKTSEECTRSALVVPESKKPALENTEDPLSSMDASLYSSISTILEDLNNFEGLSSSPLPQIEDDQLCAPKANPVSGSAEDMVKLASSSSLLSSSPYLLGENLGDNLEDIFEDIDTSMYDSDPWASSNLLNFKTFSNVDDIEDKNGESTVLALSEWDYLMDVFGESQELLATSAVSLRTQ